MSGEAASCCCGSVSIGMLERDCSKRFLQLSDMHAALLVVSEPAKLFNLSLQRMLSPNSLLRLRQEVRALPGEEPLLKLRPLP